MGTQRYRKLIARLFLVWGGCTAIPTANAGSFCAIVCGEKLSSATDWNLVFKDDEYCRGRGPVQVGKFSCERFDSWSAADAAVLREAQAKRLLPDDELLVIQRTHGGPGGSASCNDGVESPSRVLASLQLHQKTYRVGAVIDSCYSGDLLEKKLLADESAEPGRLDRLCLVTASAPGRVSYPAFHAKGLAPKKISLEAWAASNDYQLSSSPWESAGVLRYLRDENNQTAATALRNLSEWMTPAKLCSDSVGMRSLQLCLHPKVRAEVVELLMRFTIPDSEGAEGFKDAWARMNEFIPKEGDVEYGVRPPERGAAGGERLECTALIQNSPAYSVLANAFRDLGKMRPLIGPLLQFRAELRALAAQKEFAVCETFGKWRLPYEPLAEVPGSSLEAEILGPKFLAYVRTVEKMQNQFHAWLGKDADLSGITPENVAAVFTRSQETACTPADFERKAGKVMAALLGDGFRDPYRKYEPYPAPDSERVLSPYAILTGFRDAALSTAEFPEPADEARRRACRDFKF